MQIRNGKRGVNVIILLLSVRLKIYVRYRFRQIKAEKKTPQQ
jgi:hypothetical protein